MVIPVSGSLNEADTCREMVRPKLEAAGWHQGQHTYAEQAVFTDGRIVVTRSTVCRLKKKRADFLLRYTRDVTLAVVEAKRIKKPPGTGLQQAKEYAEILGLRFAYATNGREIVEFDYLTGQERMLDAFPTPDALWQCLLAANPLDTRAVCGSRALRPSRARPSWPSPTVIASAANAIPQRGRKNSARPGPARARPG
jgi:type I restriction enzyme, R subunit